MFASCKESGSGTVSAETDGMSIPISGEFAQDDIKAQYTYDESTDVTSVSIRGKQQGKYEISGIVNKYFFANVDDNDADELFVVSKDKTGDDHLAAWHIATGSPIEIYIKPIQAAKKGSTEYSAQNGQIVARHTHTDTKGTSITNDLRYNLIAGEAGYSLKPQGWTREQLTRMSGQYAAGDKSDLGYYKIMMINETSNGEWTVDLYAKNSKTKSVICEYHGIAEWINRDLIMPLTPDGNPDDGQISIRIVGLNASVYTTKTSDIKKLIDYCGGKASLAANYKKTDISN